MNRFVLFEEYSGKRFNQIIGESDRPLIKVFNDQENHNGFQYKEGLNELTEEFFPYSESCSGGFYFTASRIEFYGFLGKKK